MNELACGCEWTSPMSLSCPHCGVGPYESCIASTGRKATSTHTARLDQPEAFVVNHTCKGELWTTT